MSFNWKHGKKITHIQWNKNVIFMMLFVAWVGFRFYKLTLVYNNKACVPYATLVLSMYNSDPAIWWVILNESLNNNLSCRYSECVIFHYKVFRVHIPLMHARWRPLFFADCLAKRLYTRKYTRRVVAEPRPS